jgi:hypothetical protein
MNVSLIILVVYAGHAEHTNVPVLEYPETHSVQRMPS